MILVATFAPWPRIDDIANPVLRNYVKYLSSSPAQRQTEPMRKVCAHYNNLLSTTLNHVPCDDEIWNSSLIATIDAIFIKHVQPRAEVDFGSSESTQWKTAMDTYWHQVNVACAESWSSGPHGHPTAHTPDALHHAPAKLAWIQKLRTLGEGYDLPLPTPSAVSTLYRVFESVSYGIQWVSSLFKRPPQPLCHLPCAVLCFEPTVPQLHARPCSFM